MNVLRSFGQQFQLPRGPAGRLAGWLMALANAGMNRFTLELMQVTPDDQILEIGFGPGELIGQLAALATRGFVAGIDPSETMVAQATARNRAAIEAGRVELRPGDISAIPYPDARFDKVCTVNTIYFWPDPAANLREVSRVLKPGGRVFITFRVKRGPGRRLSFRSCTGAFADGSVAELRSLLHQAGFVAVSGRLRRLTLVTAACISARKPD